MGSIPHGTTINAQCLVSTSTIVQGAPDISPVSITPFDEFDKKTFISQTVANPNTPRIPQDLKLFIEEGTITQPILDDPATVLREVHEGQDIVKTVTFKVSTEGIKPVVGGEWRILISCRGMGGFWEAKCECD